jgi:hypothetical protein
VEVLEEVDVKQMVLLVDLEVQVLDVVVVLIYTVEVLVTDLRQTHLKEMTVDQITSEVVEVVEEPQLLDQEEALLTIQQELEVQVHQIILQEVQ